MALGTIKTPEWYQHTFAGRARVEPLTGLRWFAALAVCLSHNVPGGDTPSWIRTMFTNGYMGVTIFFVLSGFVLTITYGQSMARPTAVVTWNYMVARLARIMPLYLLVLVFIVTRGTNPVPQTGAWAHFLALQTWSDNVDFAYSMNGPGWSVGVELFLYAIFPVLMVVLLPVLSSTKRVVALAVLVIAAMASLVLAFHAQGLDSLPWSDPASAHRWLYRTPLTRIGDFLLGICMALIYVRQRHRPALTRFAPWSAALLVVVMLTLMATPQLTLTAVSFDLLYAVPGALLLLALALQPDRGVAKFMGLMLIVALGELSYAFYLLHWPVGGMLLGGVLANGFSTSSLTAFLIGLLLLIAMSWGMHVIFERPAREFVRKRFSARSPASASQGSSAEVPETRTSAKGLAG